MTTHRHAAPVSTSDREISVTRTVAAPPAVVFEAFTEVRHLARWWGPEGFTTTTRSFSFEVGGTWDFVMHGPDGTDYPNWVAWEEITPPEQIVLRHGAAPDDPDAFRSTITFVARNGDTDVTLHTVFPTAEHRRRAAEEYHAIEGAQQTLQHLAHYVEAGTKETQ